MMKLYSAAKHEIKSKKALYNLKGTRKNTKQVERYPQLTPSRISKF